MDNSAGTPNKTTFNNIAGITGDPLGTSDTQNVGNKTLDNTNTITLKDNLFTLQDGGGVTRQAQFQLSGITAGQTRVFTFPDYNATLATIGGTETLLAKTLTSPVINTATIVNPTLTTDTISEYTAANGVTVDGLNIKDGKLNTNNSVVTANITAASVTPAQWTNPYCFRAYASGATTIADAAPTKVLLATENYDYNNNFATSTYTAPVAGVYHFDGRLEFATAIASGVAAFPAVYVNGAEAFRGSTLGTGTFTTGSFTTISSDILLAAGDTVDFYMYQDSAGTEDAITGSSKTFFSGHLVRQTP